jgi:hypothetical protein
MRSLEVWHGQCIKDRVKQIRVETMNAEPNVEISQSLSTNEENSKLQVRIHGVDGSLATFTQDDQAVAEHIVEACQRPDFFKQARIAVAGQHSVTFLVLSNIARIDLAGEGLPPWKPPFGIGMNIPDIVELPEQEFLYQVEARDFKHLDRRRVRFAPGKLAAVYTAIQLVGGHHIYLKVRIVDVPRAERLLRLCSFMELPGLSFRLDGGGFGLVNLTNAVKFSSYPGPAEVPTTTWSANEGQGDDL